ncbi:Asp-tRNAAsn/Glu-tRNAGln amidotransferase A subunit [Kaistia soli DSM 19436]|uniref:Asp-tRNAAsn/Glu-tRNAGln amidotransferase A subunit n=1 Tax=Kaistia soli DSM 19436 TaxID=1122133 RepID=A0A1M5GBU7_9HYPH|nr:amidase [Kaistia soli]SHG00962.1 Asp-tRNAAsn/Glu-tRNAGln amidotransferase A subunit [Kaistia soli DSM 19436]
MPRGVAAPCDLDASSALALIRSRQLGAEELVRSCLDRIAEREPTIRAFVSVDADASIAAARLLDNGVGRDGPLQGLPFGVKDVIDVAGMETQFGSDLPIGRVAHADAAVVATLRRAGAIVLGKTESVELAATGRIPPTRNPRDPTRTPGGSSSGSAAAVAAGMVPFAIGTQTGGSLVRPASYVGIHALKPSHGVVPVGGVHPHAPSLDCVGWHARSVADLALVASLFPFPPAPRPVAADPRRLRVGICWTPQWDEVDGDGRFVFQAAVDRLAAAGIDLGEATLPPLFDGLSAAQLAIMRGEARISFRRYYDCWREQMHPDLAAIFEEDAAPRAGTTDRLADALALAARCRAVFADLAHSFDAIIAPATTGAAPLIGSGTGLPTMNRMWTALHVPIVALPTSRDGSALPIGCQLIGRFREDNHLLQVAAHIDSFLQPTS